MRTIKFRAWDGEKMVVVNDIVFNEGKAIGYWKENSVYEHSELIMQFTGLLDKNGVEIYEGDRVRLHLFTQELGYNSGVTEGEKIHTGVVEFWEYGIALNAGDNENNFYLTLAPGMLHEESFEVIGNICQSPEIKEL